MSVTHHARNDFDGDGRSDILWRHDSGIITNWLATPSGGFVSNWANFNHNIGLQWSVVGTGDFNDDGLQDVLFLGDSGILISWLQTNSSGFQPDWENATIVTTDWKVVGTADFNGDGHTDILWRNDNGLVTNWLCSSDGTTIVDVPDATFAANWNNANFNVPAEWSIVGLGDFDGDGRADILWRKEDGQITDWLGQMNGGFSVNSVNASTAVSADWTVVGTGDFNGDGRSDILWRHTDGALTDWLGQDNGGFTANWNNASYFVDNGWTVAATGDYNGDGRDDILWRYADGTVTDWLGQEDGGFISNWNNAAITVAGSWHVLPDGYSLL